MELFAAWLVSLALLLAGLWMIGRTKSDSTTDT